MKAAKTALEEERRLFYVTVTRAKDELYLTYPFINQSPRRRNHDAPLTLHHRSAEGLGRGVEREERVVRKHAAGNSHHSNSRFDHDAVFRYHRTMSQPPPPPPSSTSDQEIHISRDGKILGVFPASAIRQKLISGELKLSDHCWYDGADGWMRLISEPPFPASLYPYLGEDRPFYYVREGLLFGPRTSAEIDALVAAEWLGNEDIVTCLGSDKWWTVEELMNLANEDDDNGNQHDDDEETKTVATTAEEPGFDWITHGLRAYAGDPVSGAEIGVQTIKRAFAWIADVADAPQGNPKPQKHRGDSPQAHCKTCGTSILPATFRLNDGKCFRCNPRKKNR